LLWAYPIPRANSKTSIVATDSNVSVLVSSLTGIMAIAGGGWHSLALKSDGTVWAWGHNYSGQLGNGTNIDSNVPVQVV
jgi:alpha-tubulin suppressor-like RCC1 family protein